MIALALTIFVLGFADLILGGLSATVDIRAWRKSIAVTFILSLIASYAYYVNTSCLELGIGYFALVWAGSSVWVLARSSEHKVWLVGAIGALSFSVLGSAFVIPALGIETDILWLQYHMQKLPWNFGVANSPDTFVLLISYLLFLGPTSNAIVRTCLQIVRSIPVSESEKTLKGGRLIGPLERVLIFGLALAGEPTAAALIISAKSIIRFPELQSKSTGSAGSGENRAEGLNGALLIDELTEYFLLGSLLSWGLALAASLAF